jgi:hypothetical protein
MEVFYRQCHASLVSASFSYRVSLSLLLLLHGSYSRHCNFFCSLVCCDMVCWGHLGGGWAQSKSDLRNGFFAEMPEPNHMPPRLHLLVAARSRGNSNFRCLWFIICLGMDTLDFSFLDMLCCRLWWVHVLGSCRGRLVWSLALTPSTAPAATPQQRVHCAATAALMSLCLGSKWSLLSSVTYVVPQVVLLLFLLRSYSLWPDCLGSVVVDARMVDAYCLIYSWYTGFYHLERCACSEYGKRQTTQILTYVLSN